MKKGDLVSVRTNTGVYLGVFIKIIVFNQRHLSPKYAKIFVLRSPDGRFIGERHPFRMSLMEVINESR